MPLVSTFEDLVRHHVEGYMASAQQYAQLTELARRVAEWEENIIPKLAEEVGHRLRCYFLRLLTELIRDATFQVIV